MVRVPASYQGSTQNGGIAVNVDNLPKLLESIDQLISWHVKARPRAGSTHIGTDPADVDEILEFGVYPPDDPSSVPRRAILAIGTTLGAISGFNLMKQVYDAYEAKYGPGRAGILSARWDTAAGVWHY